MITELKDLKKGMYIVYTDRHGNKSAYKVYKVEDGKVYINTFYDVIWIFDADTGISHKVGKRGGSIAIGTEETISYLLMNKKRLEVGNEILETLKSYESFDFENVSLEKLQQIRDVINS